MWLDPLCRPESARAAGTHAGARAIRFREWESGGRAGLRPAGKPGVNVEQPEMSSDGNRWRDLNMATEYGLLLPHFGPETDRDRIIGGARRAEQMGFDSVWVRDHLVFIPMEWKVQTILLLTPLSSCQRFRVQIPKSKWALAR